MCSDPAGMVNNDMDYDVEYSYDGSDDAGIKEKIEKKREKREKGKREIVIVIIRLCPNGGSHNCSHCGICVSHLHCHFSAKILS